jgi:hypothetical protein
LYKISKYESSIVIHAYPIPEKILSKEETATPGGKRPWFAVTGNLGFIVLKFKNLRSRVIANDFCEAISSGTGRYPIAGRFLTKEEIAAPQEKRPGFAMTRVLGYIVVKPRPSIRLRKTSCFPHQAQDALGMLPVIRLNAMISTTLPHSSCSLIWNLYYN